MTNFEKTLDYVLATPKTKRQIQQYLRRKQIDIGESETIINRLMELGYINDASYAELFTTAKSQKIGKGQIKNKLYQRGVSSEIIETQIAKIHDQSDLCNYTAEKYMRNKTLDQKTRNKLYNHLITKGFDRDEITNAIKIISKTL